MLSVQEDLPQDMLVWWRHPGWYRALTLAERAASRPGGSTFLVEGDDERSEHARQLLQQWKAQPPFHKGTHFAERLALEGLTERGLFQLLAEPLAALQARVPLPEWLNSLAQAIGQSPPSKDETLPIPGANTPGAAFLSILQPLLTHAQHRLLRLIEEVSQIHRHVPVEVPLVVPSLLAALSQRLLSQASRTLALELKVAGTLGQLSGQTPEARFHSFVRRLCQREALVAFLEEYSVLARHLVLTCDAWVDSSLELLRRLCADWDEIRATFTPHSDPGVLTQIESGGDFHRQGRSVFLLAFSTGFRLVYKPKSLAIDRHFQELLQWLNDQGADPPFKTLTVLDHGTYGWAEFLPARECTSEAEVQRFYARQGAYLALLSVLGATDLHFENLIAAGEYPMLIDLETLFHPHLMEQQNLFADAPAHEALADSVYRIGLLPHRQWGTEEAEGVNLSGLGGGAGQLTPRRVPRWEAVGTDQMRLVRTRVELPEALNLPRRNGQAVDALAYREALLSGFRRLYHLLLTHRETLVATLLPRFAQDSIRFVARPTDLYARFLADAFRPEVLRDALERDRHFDRLWVGMDHRAQHAKLIPAERADLFQGDIPFFTTTPASRDLITSRGAILPDMFQESSLARVSKRFERLGEEDLAQQIWIINAAFDGEWLNAQGKPRALRPLPPARTNATPARLLTAAQTIGDHLARRAVRSEHAVGWLGLAQKNERDWGVQPAWLDLYNGLPGIALFLAYLGHLTGEQRFRDLAHGTLYSIQTVLRHSQGTRALKSLGAFTGWGGVIYLFSHLGALWQEPALFQEAESLVELLPSLIAHDQEFDLVTGAAGGIAGLLSLYAVAPSARTLEVAIHCGEHLVSHAQPQPVGIGWVNPHLKMPCTGLAHGNAGIALSLLGLAAVSGEDRFHQAARAALTYERSCYSPTQRNWYDLPEGRAGFRDSQLDAVGAASGKGQRAPALQHFRVSWCHGAGGIGLSRLAVRGYVEDELLQEEIEMALQTTLEQGFGGPTDLCCGDVGNLETLLVASQSGQRTQFEEHVQHLAGLLLDRLEPSQQTTALAGSAPLGLMKGVAGIGYELLRLAEPECVPSVLSLAPPVVTR
jgi:type 2 lantibiotic biosynthesis protein LanM